MKLLLVFDNTLEILLEHNSLTMLSLEFFSLHLFYGARMFRYIAFNRFWSVLMGTSCLEGTYIPSRGDQLQYIEQKVV